MALDDHRARRGGVFPAEHLRALAFQVLVDRKEVRDFLHHVRINLRVVVHFLVTRIVARHGKNLFVFRALVDHLQHADGADFDQAAGETWIFREHEHVQRVAVAGKRGRDKTIVARIMHRRIQTAIETEHVKLLVVLVLVLFAEWNFDDGIHDFGHVFANRQMQVIH